jgi:hypothetical protein
MTIEEAKFILSAFRPNGSDAGSATFCDALHMAGDDPMLKAWFAQSRAHDEAVAGKLRQINPPEGLREAILAGVRVSDPRGSKGLGWGWIAGLAAAAALVIGVFSIRAPVHPESGASTLAGFAISDMVNQRHGSSGEPASALVAELRVKGAKMPSAEQIDFERLRDTGCRTLNFAGHDVLEVCFLREGAQYHFYVTRRDGPIGNSVTKGPTFVSKAAGAAAVWSDTRFDYVLATTAGVEALRRLL